jgi:5-deoxy-glucuronate isomerase
VIARRYLPAGSAAHGGHDVSVTAAEAGWNYCGLTVRTLTAGESFTFVSDGFECAVLPLAGGSLTVEAETKRFALEGRETVFARVTDAAYIPLDTEVRVSSVAGCQIALPSARATRRFEPAYIAAGEVSVEPRGAGPATRQVTNFLTPGVFDACDKLVCCELLTPDGNWSSYPPHRHDGEDVGDGSVCPATNEEIYYFRIGEAGTTRFAPKGFGLHRTYTADGAIDDHVSVGDGDVYLVPRGYHGPCVAAPGYPMYYLNVLAGPGDDRTMAFCDDPAHHWVRDAWASMPLDPRVPMTNMNGVVS